MSASSEFCWAGLQGLRVDLDNSELRQAANFAGVFLICFSAFGLFSQTKTREGRPGLGRLYSRRDLARCLWRHVKSPSSPPTRSSDVGLPTGWREAHIIWKSNVFSEFRDLSDWRCRPRGFRRLRNQQICMVVSKTPHFRKLRISTNFGFRNFRNDGRAICVSKVPCRNMTFRFGRHQPGRPNSETSKIC